MTPDPRTAAWLDRVLATAPPLSPAQLAALRPVCQRMAQHMTTNAAPARQQEPRPVTEQRSTA